MILLCQTDPTVGQSERRARRFVAVDGAARRPRLSVVFPFIFSVRCVVPPASRSVLPCRAERFAPSARGHSARLFAVCRACVAPARNLQARPLVSPCAAGPLPRGQNNTSPAFGLTTALRRYVPQSGDFLCKDRFFCAKNAFVRLPNGKKRRFFKFFAKYI